MLTPAGFDADMTAAAVNAGINRYQDSGYFTKDMQPIKMALVPTDALPEISDEVQYNGAYSRWDKHLLALASVAMQEAMDGYSDDPVPLILACPEHYKQWPHQLPDNLIKNLIVQTGLPINPEDSRTIHVGRSGAIEALKIAERFLFEAETEYVLIGGVDSYQRPELFRGLLEYGRLSIPGNMDGFVPGEGAAFILVTRSKENALEINNHKAYIVPSSLGEEPGHIYSEESYLGEGLSATVTELLQEFSGPNIRNIYSTMNGESFWSKELGVMLTRNNSRIEKTYDIEHPAECFGDMGAASAAALIGLAAMQLMNNNAYTSHLVCASSDHQYRAAAALSIEAQES